MNIDPKYEDAIRLQWCIPIAEYSEVPLIQRDWTTIITTCPEELYRTTNHCRIWSACVGT